MEKIVILAIPMYFGSLLLEAWFSARKKKNFYRLKDSFGNLGTGIMMQLLEVFTKAPLVAGYVYLYQNFNITERLGFKVWELDIRSLHGLLSWVLAFLLIDFVYYVFHRHSHEVNFLWAAHSVHHSSEEYNFSVALRQSTFQGLFSALYTGTLALIGVPPEMILPCWGLNLIYQFFLHTRFVGKLGPFEWIFNTPSHHRVHHARQGKYLDCNYAGVFIIWDRLCGSFIPEAEEPKYGVYPRFQSYDPVRANFLPIIELVHYFRIARGRDKLRVLFSGPLWLYENFKKGKSLNIMDNGRIADGAAYLSFAGALSLALLVLFLPDLAILPKIFLVLASVFLLGVMGRRLDRAQKESDSSVRPSPVAE